MIMSMMVMIMPMIICDGDDMSMMMIMSITIMIVANGFSASHQASPLAMGHTLPITNHLSLTFLCEENLYIQNKKEKQQTNLVRESRCQLDITC